MAKMKRSILIVCCALLLAGAVAYAWTLLPGPRFLQSYKRLHIGMPRSDVQALFGQQPEYYCRFGRSEIWYYAAPGMFPSDFPSAKPKAGATYKSLGELPDAYDRVQIAFDENGNLAAYTWIGETYTVEYRGGSVKGSHFKLLPPGVL